MKINSNEAHALIDLCAIHFNQPKATREEYVWKRASCASLVKKGVIEKYQGNYLKFRLTGLGCNVLADLISGRIGPDWLVTSDNSIRILRRTLQTGCAE